MNIPHTPFATGLSRSARETERRIRSIFAGPKEDPPKLLVVLAALGVLLCGNLVSCQSGEEGEPAQNVRPAVSGTAAQTDASLTDMVRLAAPLPEGWAAGEVDSFVTPEWLLEEPFACLTEEEAALVQNLPAAELPRQAVDPREAAREDYWRDLLLPVASSEAEDVTIYFVVSPGSLSDVEPGAAPVIGSPYTDGVVLRRGERTAYFPLEWGINAKFAEAPAFLVKDLNGDGRPEAALSLAWGEGTGAWCECLYIFDLDTMTYALPDYTEIPLELTYNGEGTAARLASGDLEHEVDLTWLAEPFQGRAEVGNIVEFRVEGGQILCCLDLDFTCNTLGYWAEARFPIVWEDGVYRLGPAVWMENIL